LIAINRIADCDAKLDDFTRAPLHARHIHRGSSLFLTEVNDQE